MAPRSFLQAAGSSLPNPMIRFPRLLGFTLGFVFTLLLFLDAFAQGDVSQVITPDVPPRHYRPVDGVPG